VVTSSLIWADLAACPVTGGDLPSFRSVFNWASWRPVFGSIFVAVSLTSAPGVIGASGAERDWVGFALEGVAEAGSCFSDFVLSCAFWVVLLITVSRSAWRKSCVGLFTGSFRVIKGVLSVVVGSRVLGGGGVSSAAGDNRVAFVNVLGLGAGGAATAVPANNILSIVNKFVFIHSKPIKPT